MFYNVDTQRGLFNYNFEVDQDQSISKFNIDVGFTHRSIEKIAESLSYDKFLNYSYQIDQHAPVYGAFLWCETIEKFGDIKVSDRGKKIRIILLELFRIINHFNNIISLIDLIDIKIPKNIYYYIKHYYNLIKEITKTPLGFHYFTFGGVKYDISNKVIDSIIYLIDDSKKIFNQLLSIFLNSESLKMVLKGVGILKSESIKSYNITGVNSIASGINRDIRKNEKGGYKNIKFLRDITGNISLNGDSYDRTIVRIEQMVESLDIIKQIIKNLSDDPSKIDYKDKILLPKGEYYNEIESPRGILGCYIISNGEDIPWRVKFRSPSLSTLGVIENIMVGERVGDCDLIIKSLDISISEIDR